MHLLKSFETRFPKIAFHDNIKQMNVSVYSFVKTTLLSIFKIECKRILPSLILRYHPWKTRIYYLFNVDDTLKFLTSHSFLLKKHVSRDTLIVIVVINQKILFIVNRNQISIENKLSYKLSVMFKYVSTDNPPPPLTCG